MDITELNKILCETYGLGQAKIQNISYKVNGLKILKLRDALIEIGTIDFEDLDSDLYIARIYKGFLKRNPAMLAFHLDGDMLHIASYAKEGLINQNTCGGAVNELRKALGDYFV